MHNLYDRLKRQREAESARGVPGAAVRLGPGAPNAAAEQRQPDNTPVRGLDPPWQRVAGEVWRAVYRTTVALEPLRSSVACGGLLTGPETELQRLRFFDTETTGLSGGAGTTVFLAAFGRLAGDELETTLLFLSDFSGEPEFLALVRDELKQAQRLVSYNGRGFDSSILRNRFLLNRLPPVDSSHIDLLHPTRRLFAGILASCALSVVESELLGVRRLNDIDSAAVPATWLHFLRSRDAAELRDVFAHVLQDVASLVGLLARIEQQAAGPESSLPLNQFQRARLLIEAPYRPAASLSLRLNGLRSIAAIASDTGHPQSARAARYFCSLQRRRGAWQDAFRIWCLHYERLHSLWAAMELAKFYEHQKRDPHAAMEIVVAAADWPHARAAREELRHRRLRLERKLARVSLPAG